MAYCVGQWVETPPSNGWVEWFDGWVNSETGVM